MKKDLLNININESEIEALADRLKEKPLYTWLELDLNNIKDIEIIDVVQVLIRYEKINRFINEIKNRNELSYILRNYDSIEMYNSLQEIKNDIQNVDEYWTKLKTIMKYDDEYVKVLLENIKKI